MKYLLFISTLLLSYLGMAQVTIQPQATLWIGDQARLSVDGGVINEGSFQNLGNVSFTGDWTNTNTYNDAGTGMLQTSGSGSQSINNGDQSVGILEINSGIETVILGNTFEVMTELSLTNGIVRLGDGTSLVINENATITGGGTSSFIEGTVIQKGGGTRFYPLGIESFYMPLTLLDIQNSGTNLEMSVRVGLYSDAGVTPLPGRGVVGVSDYHYWELTEINGSFFDPAGTNGSIVQAQFDNANISPTAFGSTLNDFSRAATTVGLVQSSTLEGEYFTIKGELSADDFVEDTSGPNSTGTAEFGTIDTVDPVNQMFVGVGLVAASNPDGILFVPSAFSPAAMVTEDQTFRAFGDNIVDQPFKMVVYNSFGVEVYSVDNFNEATTIGWDGTNPNNGNDEPMGSYRWFIQYQNNDEVNFKENGVVLLIR